MKRKGSIGITVFATIVLLFSGVSIFVHVLLLNTNTQQTFRAQAKEEIEELSSQIKRESPHSSIGAEDEEEIKAHIKKAYPEMEQHRHEELAKATQQAFRKQAIGALVYSILIFISGIAILLRRNFGRISFLSIIVLKFLFDVSRLIFTGAHMDFDFNSVFFNIIVPILIILGSMYYLTRPAVNEQFK